jgi:NADH-quinone oxidoreductase subunit N
MTRADFMALLPLLITAYSAVALAIVLPFWRSRRATFWLTAISLAAALASIVWAIPYAPRQVTSLILIDRYSLFFDWLILVVALLVTLLSRDYFEDRPGAAHAYYLLLLLAVLGMIATASSSHFVSFFLAYETLSVSLVGLIGFLRGHKLAQEAAVKYLVLSITSSAFLVFGMALVYYDLGTMEFARLAPMLSAGGLAASTYFGLALMLVGFGFKLALVPFHTWSPDVYQGAPAPVTALIATGSKAAVFALLLRMVSMGGLGGQRTTFLLLYVLAVATMFGGNLLALLQDNIKRLLAYSSVAQIGYLLIPLLADGLSGPSSIAFYFVSYAATTIAAFGVISVVSRSGGAGDVERIDDYRGLALSHPALAVVLSTALLSLMGLPLTSGFFGKFYIFTAAAQSGLWSLLVIGVVTSGMSAFYYLRVVFAMYSRPQAGREPLPAARSASAICLTVSTTIVVLLGIYPTPLFRLVQSAVTALGLR